jgi:hypothetical protein
MDFHGYQADLAAKHSYWGYLYEEGGRGIMWHAKKEANDSVKVGDWNRYEIVCEGSKLKQVLNGIVSGELDDKDEAKRKLEGIIALQYHAPGEGFEVRLKNIKIKKLQ